MPEEFQYLFKGNEEVLSTHRAYDPGAFEIATYLSEHLQAPLFACHNTRLLVETNRSLNSAELFSEFSRNLDEKQQKEILHQFYHPYRNQVMDAAYLSRKPVLHISVHTFTPVWQGKKREVDIGLLFDPKRKSESDFCIKWQLALQENMPGKKICLNEPYLGIADGFTTYLRTQYPERDYLGIEIEINQQYYFDKQLENISKSLTVSLQECLN